MSDRPDLELNALARRVLATTEPSPERAARVKADLLAEAERAPQAPPRSANRRRAVIGIAVAASTLLAVVGTRYGTRPALDPAITDKPPRATATVIASGAATFERYENPETRDELVHLKEGLIRVDVAKIVPSRRVVVECDDARIVVVGTSFQVRVHRGRLQHVQVFSGRVEVQVKGEPPRQLDPGDEYRGPAAPSNRDFATRATPNTARAAKKTPNHDAKAQAKGATGSRETPSAKAQATQDRTSGARAAPNPNAKAPAAGGSGAKAKRAPGRSRSVGTSQTASASAHRAPRTRTAAPGRARATGSATVASPTPPIPSPSESAFQQGWAALAEARYRAAARAFRAADQAGSPVREEARYWRAVALLRADKRHEAEAMFRLFLHQYDRSPRRGEAALLLARLRLLASDPNGARPWLEVALKSTEPAVQNRARNLLDKINRPPQ